MAHHEMNTMMTAPQMVWELVGNTTSMAGRTARKTGQSLMNGMEKMAQASRYYKAAQRIAEMSDDELEAKGTTRAEVIQRAFGGFV